MNEELIDVLIKMGAERIVFTEGPHDNDILKFEFDGKTIKIEGLWYNNGCAGITSDVYDT